MGFDTNYGNYRNMGIDDRLPDFDDIFTKYKYVNESIGDMVRDLFNECIPDSDYKEEYWEEFRELCKDCI